VECSRGLARLRENPARVERDNCHSGKERCQAAAQPPVSDADQSSALPPISLQMAKKTILVALSRFSLEFLGSISARFS
jgi:hypothetical protein